MKPILPNLKSYSWMRAWSAIHLLGSISGSRKASSDLGGRVVVKGPSLPGPAHPLGDSIPNGSHPTKKKVPRKEFLSLPLFFLFHKSKKSLDIKANFNGASTSS